eukprot:scaffold3266_cov236-Ochromonas_danica.AAC.3
MGMMMMRVRHHQPHRVKYQRPLPLPLPLPQPLAAVAVEEESASQQRDRVIRQSKYFNAMTLASSKQEYQPRLFNS